MSNLISTNSIFQRCMCKRYCQGWSMCFIQISYHSVSDHSMLDISDHAKYSIHNHEFARVIKLLAARYNRVRKAHEASPRLVYLRSGLWQATAVIIISISQPPFINNYLPILHRYSSYRLDHLKTFCSLLFQHEERSSLYRSGICRPGELRRPQVEAREGASIWAARACWYHHTCQVSLQEIFRPKVHGYSTRSTQRRDV